MSMIQEQHKKLQRSTVISKALLSSIESVLYIKDINNEYITVNNAFRKLLLLTPQYDVSGKKDSDFFSGKEAKQNFEQDQNILQTGKAIKNIEGYIPGSRKKKMGLISKVPIFDSENKIVGIIANFIDITERVEASKNRKLLEKAINNIEDCIWIAKDNEINIGKVDILFVNDSIKRLTGFSKEDFKRNPEIWKNFLQTKYYNKRIQDRKTAKYPTINEYKANKINAPEHMEITIREKIYYDETEKIFLGIVEDITKYRKNREVRILLEKVLGKSRDIVWIRESPPSNKLLYVSKSVYEMYGYPPETYYSDSEFWYNNSAHPEDRKELIKFRDNRSWPNRKIHRIITRSKEIRWIETSILKSRFLDKQCIAYIERDVTERIKEEAKIVDNTKMNIALSLKDKGVSAKIIKEATGITLPMESDV